MNEIKMILLDFQVYIVKHILTTLKKILHPKHTSFLKTVKGGQKVPTVRGVGLTLLHPSQIHLKIC